jgi:hypothetical protein
VWPHDHHGDDARRARLVAFVRRGDLRQSRPQILPLRRVGDLSRGGLPDAVNFDGHLWMRLEVEEPARIAGLAAIRGAQRVGVAVADVDQLTVRAWPDLRPTVVSLRKPAGLVASPSKTRPPVRACSTILKYEMVCGIGSHRFPGAVAARSLCACAEIPMRIA